MGQPEERLQPDNDRPEKTDAEPGFEAVTPDGPDARQPDEIFKDLDDYQKRIESEWETAKKSYQEKIDDILKGLPPAEPEQPAETPPPEKPSDERFSRFMEEAEKALRRAHADTRTLRVVDSNRLPGPIKSLSLSFGRHRIAVGVALAAGLALALVFSAWHVPKPVSLPYAHASGLNVDAGHLIVADWFRQALYRHDEKDDMAIKAVEALPNPFLTGLAVSESRWYSIDGLSNELLVHAPTPDHRVLDRFSLPGAQMAGLWFDGTDVWTFDNASPALYRLRGNDIEDVRERFSAPGLQVAALQLNGYRLWALDAGTRELHVFRLEEPLRKLASFDLDPFLSGAKPTGFRLDGNAVRLLMESPAQIRQIPLRRLKRADPNAF